MKKSSEHEAGGKGGEVAPGEEEPKAEEAVAGADSEEDEDIQVQAERVPEDAEATEIKAVPRHREKQHAVELTEKTMLPAPKVVLEVDTIRRGQEQQPMMAAIRAYVGNNILPKDKLMRIRVLEQAQEYEVNQAGLLCRVRERGNKGSLGLDMQVVVPEALRTAVVAGCHEGGEGHGSVINTYQKVRDRFYSLARNVPRRAEIHKILSSVQPQHRQEDKGSNKATCNGMRTRRDSGSRLTALPEGQGTQISAGGSGCVFKVGRAKGAK